MHLLNHRNAALSMSFLLIGVNIVATVLAFRITDICQFEFCENAISVSLAWIVLGTQLNCLSTAWLAHAVGRNGYKWLSYACIAMALAINVLLFASDRGHESISIIAALFLLAAPPVQFLWLLLRCWRQIGGTASELPAPEPEACR